MKSFFLTLEVLATHAACTIFSCQIFMTYTLVLTWRVAPLRMHGCCFTSIFSMVKRSPRKTFPARRWSSCATCWVAMKTWKTAEGQARAIWILVCLQEMEDMRRGIFSCDVVQFRTEMMDDLKNHQPFLNIQVIFAWSTLIVATPVTKSLAQALAWRASLTALRHTAQRRLSRKASGAVWVPPLLESEVKALLEMQPDLKLSFRFQVPSKKIEPKVSGIDSKKHRDKTWHLKSLNNPGLIGRSPRIPNCFKQLKHVDTSMSFERLQLCFFLALWDGTPGQRSS